MTVSIRLDPFIEQRLDRLASQTGRSKSYYPRELIESGLDDLEDYYLADATMERVRKGQEVVVDSSEVRGGDCTGQVLILVFEGGHRREVYRSKQGPQGIGRLVLGPLNLLID